MSTYIDMEVAMVVYDTPGKQVEIEGSSNVFAFQTTPLKSSQADLERKESAYSSTISRILVSESVELVRLVIQSDL